MIQRVLKAIAEAEGRAAGAPALDRLFRRLGDKDALDASEVQELIWSSWVGHAEPAASERMRRAIAAVNGKRLNEAEALLDDLVRDYPEWAEAWNKRATLYYILKRDLESLYDIERTIRLEPRHFGAISGFAQICLRHGELPAALSGFATALSINPHMEGVRQAVTDLTKHLKKSFN